MLFNSYIFIFAFLPITIVIFFTLGHFNFQRIAIAWLILASLFFYGWWKPIYLFLLVASILLNYGTGYILLKIPDYYKGFLSKRLVLIIGISLNIILLAYFKYTNFLIDNINYALGTSFNLYNIFLPLGISFYTFTQIAYLVDVYKGIAREYRFLNYVLFVTFFPHLIAGPILHHREMMPQYSNPQIFRFNSENFSVGLTVFVAGLFKKVIFADTIANYASPVFDAASTGAILTLVEAWVGAVAYSLQLYFDFSGYSDMAIGLAYMLNIKMPLNFFSPYKSSNTIEFWQRWHITLSRYLRDYLYIPLGGNRKGSIRRYINLMVTMILGGFWHGAGWTFIFWGTLHGIYLVINHAWNHLQSRFQPIRIIPILHVPTKLFARMITFIAVVIGLVFFRADTFSTAKNIITGMVGLNGISLPKSLIGKFAFLSDIGIRFDGLTPSVGFNSLSMSLWVSTLLLIVWFAPNIYEIIQPYSPYIEMPKKLFLAKNNLIRWKPSLIWAVGLSIIFTICIICLSQNSEFLYFQF